MSTESRNPTSQEILDQMLHDGKISDEDYLLLSKAMAGPPPAADTPAIACERKLLKNWERGWIGGLCAGFARYFGMDDRLARIIFIAAFALLTPLRGIGLMLVPLYFALCAFVPWDEKEKSQAFLESGCPRRFMGRVALFFFILPGIWGMLVYPQLREIYKTSDVHVRNLALDVSSEFSYWTRAGEGLIPALIIAAIVTIFLGTVYASLCRERVRRNFNIAITILEYGWLAFIILGSLFPLLGLFPRLMGS